MVREQIEIEAAYAGYLDRQRADAESLRKEEDLRLPAELDYAEIGSLSNEVREKLDARAPADPGPGGPHRRRDARRADGAAGPREAQPCSLKPFKSETGTHRPSRAGRAWLPGADGCQRRPDHADLVASRSC
jgi:hypothetical protein